jgi:hypothetical protein
MAIGTTSVKKPRLKKRTARGSAALKSKKVRAASMARKPAAVGIPTNAIASAMRLLPTPAIADCVDEKPF